MKKTETEKAEERLKLQKEQIQAVEELIAELGTVEAVAAYLGVSSNSISSWRSGKTVSKGLIRQKLINARHQDKLKIRVPRGGKKSLDKAERQELLQQLIELRLAPPDVRAATLRALLEKSALTIAAMAREIAIHENTLKDYLDPQYNRLMSLTTAEKIKVFESGLENKDPTKTTPERRLQTALIKLLGPEIVEKGFSERDSRRVRATEKISEQTGLSSRTVRRYLPPLANYPRLPMHVVEAFEKTAAQLGNIIEKAS